MHQHMDMIRHHTPGKQFIALVVKMQHGVLGDLGNSWITQMTFPNSTIKIFLQLCALLPIVFNLQQMFPLSTAGLGHGIGKAKGDELNQTGKITMRQKTTFMPAKEAQRFLFVCKRTERNDSFPQPSRARYSRLVRGGRGISKHLPNLCQGSQSIGAPSTDSAISNLNDHRAETVLGVPIYAFATNCRST